MPRAGTFLATGLLSLVAIGCGAAAATPAPAPAAPVDPADIEIVAKDIAFDPASIAVPAGAELHIRLDNRDVGVPHNVAVMADAGFSTKLAESDIVTGPAQADLVVPGLMPGRYRLVCVVHPNMITALEVGA
jgi:plastocyanin